MSNLQKAKDFLSKNEVPEPMTHIAVRLEAEIEVYANEEFAYVSGGEYTDKKGANFTDGFWDIFAIAELTEQPANLELEDIHGGITEQSDTVKLKEEFPTLAQDVTVFSDALMRACDAYEKDPFSHANKDRIHLTVMDQYQGLK